MEWRKWVHWLGICRADQDLPEQLNKMALAQRADLERLALTEDPAKRAKIERRMVDRAKVMEE